MELELATVEDIAAELTRRAEANPDLVYVFGACHPDYESDEVEWNWIGCMNGAPMLLTLYLASLIEKCKEG